MADTTDPNAQNPSGDGQTDYKAEYVKLSAQIAAGEYVAKNVYTGLQQTHEKTILAHKADKDALAALQKQAEDAGNASKTLQQQLEETRQKSESSAKELESATAKLERTKLIMAKFPHLAAFEADGLLPNAPISDLEGILSAFSEKVGTIQQNAKKEKVTGTSDAPPGSESAGSATSKQLLDEANVLARQGQWLEYNKKMDAYMASVNGGKAA